MNRRLLLVIPVILFSFLSSGLIHAAIEIKNGHWSTTFQCADWRFDAETPDPNCDGMEVNLNLCASPIQYKGVPCAETENERAEAIRGWANNPGGGGGGAQVHYFWTGVNGEGVENHNSGGLYITLPGIQEYWFRFYIYYPSYMNFAGAFSGWKTLYFDHDHSAGWYFGFPRNESSSGFFNQNTDDPPLETIGYGDDWFESNGRQGFGRWIALELHFKNDTDGADGIVQMWVDHTLVIDEDTYDFGVSEFRSIKVAENGYGPGAYDPAYNDKVVDIRLDDMMIAVPGYAGLKDDGNGNFRIGTLDVRPIPPFITIEK